MGWVWTCPYCLTDAGLRGGDVLTSFLPWRAPFERLCPECGKVSGCTAAFRAAAWYRFGMVTIWPVIVYALRVTLYADQTGFAPWGGGILLGAIPAIILTHIPGRIGERIEQRRTRDHPESPAGVRFFQIWLAIMVVTFIAIGYAAR